MLKHDPTEVNHLRMQLCGTAGGYLEFYHADTITDIETCSLCRTWTVRQLSRRHFRCNTARAAVLRSYLAFYHSF